MKQFIKEAKQLQKLAGIIKEGDLDQMDLSRENAVDNFKKAVQDLINSDFSDDEVIQLAHETVQEIYNTANPEDNRMSYDTSKKIMAPPEDF